MKHSYQLIVTVLIGAMVLSCAGDADDTSTTGEPTGGIATPRGPASDGPDIEPTEPPKPPVRVAIQSVLDGETEVPIDGAPVTYLLSKIDGLDEGFLIQADRMGPALIVAAPIEGVAVGDRVSLHVTGTVMGLNGYPTVTQFDDFAVTGRAELLDVIQDISSTESIVNSGHSFHNEYITVTGKLLADPQPPLGKPALARLATDGFFMSSASSAGLFLRFPAVLLPELSALTSGCQLTVERGYLWFDYHSMCTVMSADDITIGDCPPPAIVGATAPDQTQVSVTFSRPIEPTSVSAAQFSFDVDIEAVSASVQGRTVILTTTAHPPEAKATVTVGSEVTDVAGVAVDPQANAATFHTWESPADLRITELNASIADGNSGTCGLIELVAIAGGTTRDFVLRAHAGLSEGLPALSVEAGDVIVVHTGACNPTGAVTETFAADEQPAASHPQNYDNARDIYFQPVLPEGDLALYLLDPHGNFMDVILTTDEDPDLWSGVVDDLDKIVAHDGWLAPGGVSLQGSQYGRGLYGTVAVPYDTGTSALGHTIQRANMLDTDTREDWLTDPTSMGFAPTSR